MPRHVEISCEDLLRRYAAGQSTTALARRYGCSPTTIAKRVRDCGGSVRVSRFQPAPIPEARLRRLYLDERLPIAEIARRLGVAASTVGALRRRYGIPRRGPRAHPPR